MSYLGVDLLKALVLAHGLFGQVGAFRIPNFTIQQLWLHSLAVGAALRLKGHSGAHGHDLVAKKHRVGLNKPNYFNNCSNNTFWIIFWLFDL